MATVGNNNYPDMGGNAADLDELLALWEAALSLEDEADCPPFEGDETRSVGIVEVGVASSRFLCSFTEGRLTFDAMRLVGNVLSWRESPRTARDGMLSVVRMARLLLRSERTVSAWAAGDPGATLVAYAEDDAAGYRLCSASGEVLDSGDGWQGLVRMIDARMQAQDGGAGQVVIP